MTEASTTIDAVVETTGRVREYLAPFDDVTVNDDGSATLEWGSARVDVTVEVFDQDQSMVAVTSLCVTGAAPSPELHEYVATTSLDLGHLKVVPEDGGTASIIIKHRLIGEYLNPAELRMTVVGVANQSDELDDDLASRFGGTVYRVEGNRT